ncbi:signal peptide peptidase SppA [Thalassotalea piscium]|uniref:Protease-4 n=1 Tax=Thalassotalea piscium TaxID=1230533 RepID=A0A7X0NFJ6_9GAMM|nr:signal peptide peptidase SppA [Thalassotalea piscium]MBB6542361.1 protease-4 [Thalassotalea piscium]
MNEQTSTNTSKKPSRIGRLFSSIFSLLNTLRKTIVNLVFFTILLVFILALTSDNDKIIVPNETALVLNIRGDVVEQKQLVDPLDSFVNEAFNQTPQNQEVLLNDIVDVIKHAKNDDRVKVLVLKLERMTGSGLTKLDVIAKQLIDFKASGKKIIATGDQYDQNQYYLASFADEVWLNPNGYLLLDGYGRYQLYFKSALDKLEISQHIFRVGTYKSAVEPYMRDDMSDAAKEANKAWLDELWVHYKNNVAKQRGFSVNNFDESLSDIITKLRAVDGKIADYALNNQWVDHLKTREQELSDLTALVGTEKYQHIGFEDYLKTIKPIFPIVNPTTAKVAIVVAKGTILDGKQKPGTIGGDSTAALLKKARENKQVKAVVLRVDSPGGSAYASDIIRQEIELLKKSGKPVVASMGTYAASGGYWISAPADKIIAAPTTITGSIGIFGFFMTFENTLSKLGIHTDGVATTEFAGVGLTREITPQMHEIFQMGIERGYKDFITLVANNRNLTLEEVDTIAQGRVWTGSKAKELGLIDDLGDMNDAINIAAELAKLDSFDTLIVEKELSPRDQFLESLVGQALVYLPEETGTSPYSTGPIKKLLNKLAAEFSAVEQLNDPQGIYSLCLTCEI